MRRMKQVARPSFARVGCPALGALAAFVCAMNPANAQTADDSLSANDSTQTRSAAASEQTLYSRRGGSLGMLSSASPGVTSMLVARIPVLTGGGSSLFGLDFFAHIGTLRFAEHWGVEFLGETASIDVPTTPMTLTRPLPLLNSAPVGSSGFRFVYTTAPVEIPAPRRSELRDCMAAQREASTEAQATDDAAACAQERLSDRSLCLAVLRVGRVRNVTPLATAMRLGRLCLERGVDVRVNVADSSVRSAQNRSSRLTFLDRESRGARFTVGVRYLFAPGSQNRESASGAAGEFGFQLLTDSASFFVSMAGLALSGSREEGPTATLLRLPILEYRASIGFDFHWATAVALRTNLRPRVGLYLVAARNHWDNTFAAPGTEAVIDGSYFEGTVYFAGHFSHGFGGLVAFSVVRPYGGRLLEDWALTVSVSPVYGMPLGSD